MRSALGTLQSLLTQLPTLDAPRTPFNTTITRERSYAARTISLGDAKAIAKASGAKLNDVVMAVCSGALRRYLQEKDQLPLKPLIAGAPILLQLVMLVYGRSGLADYMPMPMNVTISNVPGPPMPLYCAGAKVTALHPVSIAAHGAALNITVQSYMDALNFGLTADRRAVPDVGRLGDYLVEAADELKKAVHAD